MAINKNSLLVFFLTIFMSMVAIASSLPTIYGFEGRILCRSRKGEFPIEGARAFIRCRTLLSRLVDRTTGPADANGYYLGLINPVEMPTDMSPQDCHAFHYNSPDRDCNSPVFTTIDLLPGVGRGLPPRFERAVNNYTGKYDMQLFIYNPLFFRPLFG